MGRRLKDMAAAPVTMIAAALDRLPTGIKGAPQRAGNVAQKAGSKLPGSMKGLADELPGKLGKLRDALPGGAKRKPSKLRRLRRVIDGAGTVISVVVTGWEVYEMVRSQKDGATSRSRSSSRSGRSSASRSSRGGNKSSRARSGSSRATSRRSTGGSGKSSPRKKSTSTRRSTSSKSRTTSSSAGKRSGDQGSEGSPTGDGSQAA